MTCEEGDTITKVETAAGVMKTTAGERKTTAGEMKTTARERKAKAAGSIQTKRQSVLSPCATVILNCCSSEVARAGLSLLL